MLNLKSSITILAFLLLVSMAFAQQANNNGVFNPTAKTDEINNAVNKLPYLQSFLAQVQGNPTKYCKSSKELRDSVNTHLQIELMTLNFSIFKDYNNKNVKKIEAEVNKAYVIGMQMIFAGQFVADAQKELELHIAKANKLISETGFFKQRS